MSLVDSVDTLGRRMGEPCKQYGHWVGGWVSLVDSVDTLCRRMGGLQNRSECFGQEAGYAPQPVWMTQMGHSARLNTA